jgi:hypothetical protein
MESRGEPDARNAGSNAIGLAQQFAYTAPGERYYGAGPKGARTPPWTHPRGYLLAGYPVSWDPNQQIRTAAGVLAHYWRAASRAGGHWPSAWLAYASGPGAVAALLAGNPPEWVAKHLNAYAPKLAALWSEYAAWYAGWVEAGRPSSSARVGSGEGTSWAVELAGEARPSSANVETFDGSIRWNGKTINAGPSGPSSSGGLGLLAGVAGVVVLGGGLLLAHATGVL